MNSGIILLTFYAFLIRSIKSDDPTIELSYGKLIGKLKSNYISFESIPYAETPIDENRFEPPKPYQGMWKEPRDATKQIHQQCLQYDSSVSQVVGSEDCLYLNVFSPTLEPGKSFPVFIFIHGGDYRFGSDHMFTEEIIMGSGKFVYVSLNYRLGPLGFLSTNCKAIPGNMGLKDQKIALKWIKENIRQFNGDPDQIILSGWSVGAASVHLHLLSKDTENLVKVAVSYSGTAFNPWGFDYTSFMNKTIAMATEFNCPMDNGMTVKNCLKKIPAEDIVSKGTTLFTKFLGYPITIFGPVVESNTSTDPFLSDFPENIIRSGNIANIPWLISRCSDEGGILAPALLNKNKNGVQNIVKFSQKFEEILPIIFYYDEHQKTDKDMMTSYLRRMYDLKEKSEITEENYWNIQRMMTEELFVNPIEDAIKLQREFSKADSFYYIFDNPPPYGFGNLKSNRSDINFGTVHGDDMLLVLKSSIRDGYPWTEVEQKLSMKFLEMLENFVKTGVAKFGDSAFPIEKGDSLSPPKGLMITKDSV